MKALRMIYRFRMIYRLHIRSIQKLISDPLILLASFVAVLSLTSAIVLTSDAKDTIIDVISNFLFPMLLLLSVFGTLIIALQRKEDITEAKRLKRNPRVFVSYSHNDSEFVDKLVKDLKSNKIDIILDEINFVVGANIKNGLEHIIKSSDYILYVNSKSSTNSKWLEIELNMAKAASKPILPIAVEDAGMPLLLENIFYADFKDSYDGGLRKVVESIALWQHGLTVR